MVTSRITFVREMIFKKKADVFLLINREGSGQPFTRYLSGFSGSSSVLLITKKYQGILTDGRYYTQVAEEAPAFQLGSRHRTKSLNSFSSIFITSTTSLPTFTWLSMPSQNRFG